MTNWIFDLPEWQRKAFLGLMTPTKITSEELRRKMNEPIRPQTIHSMIYQNTPLDPNPPRTMAEYERRFMQFDRPRAKSRVHDVLLMHSMLLTGQPKFGHKADLLVIDESHFVKSDSVKPDYLPGQEIVTWFGLDATREFREQIQSEALRYAYAGQPSGRIRDWDSFPEGSSIMVGPGYRQPKFFAQRRPNAGQYAPPPPGKAGLAAGGSTLPLTAPGGPLGPLHTGPSPRRFWVLEERSEVYERQREAYLKARNSATQVHDAVPPEQRLRVSEVRSPARNELRTGVGKPGR